MTLLVRAVVPIVLIAGTLLVVELTRRCADGWIGVNSLAGIRTPSVMTDEETWRVAHRAALPILKAWCSAPLALAILAVAMPGDAAVAASILAASAFLLIAVAHSSARGIQAARGLLARRGGLASDTSRF